MSQKEYARRQRVAPMIQRELMDLILHEFSDPRLDGVTVTEVELASDIKSARVYVSRLGRPMDEALEALLEYTGRFRGRMGKRLKLRYVPTLSFISDEVPDRAASLNALIARARASDADHSE